MDLIDRQAAIEYLMTNMSWYEEDGYETDDDEKRDAITDLINGVPSAQPERKNGEWELFQLITSAWYGKQCYSLEDNGMVYSRLSARCMSEHDALMEFLSKIGDIE